MSDRRSLASSIAARAVHIECMDPPPPEGMTVEELSALHTCKHEMIAALYRLYMTVDQKTADKLIGQYFSLPEHRV